MQTEDFAIMAEISTKLSCTEIVQELIHISSELALMEETWISKHKTEFPDNSRALLKMWWEMDTDLNTHPLAAQNS